MRMLAAIGVLLAAMLPAGASAPAQASVVFHEPPGKCPPGTYWTHLPTPGVNATASGFCKSYVVRPKANAPLPPPPPPHAHHGWPPPRPPHYHHGACPTGEQWSAKLSACVIGIVKPIGNAPLPPGAAPPCPPGSHWQAGACRPDQNPFTVQIMRQPGPVTGVSAAPKPVGQAFGSKPLRYR